jgi:peptidoglycan/LPS O-acetylase OafA/YrhL
MIGLDFLRLFAASLVIAYHFGFWHFTKVDAIFADRLADSTRDLTAPVTHFGWIGVEIFFVISGFVIAYSTQGATTASFVEGRILRLVPSVWICAPVTAIIYMAALHKTAGELVPELLRSLTFFPMFSQIDGVYWTLGIEVSFYALVVILFVNNSVDRIGTMAAWLGITSLLFWVFIYVGLALTEATSEQLANFRPWVFKIESFRPFQLLLLQHGCFFALGIYFWMLLVKKVTLRRLCFIAVLVAACLLEILAQNGIIERASQQPLSPTPAIIVWLLSMAFFIISVVFNNRLRRLSPRFSRLSRSFGIMTYPLYLIHNPIGVAVILALKTFAGVPDVPALLLGALVAIISASIISIWIEPSLRMFLKSLKLNVQTV